MYGFGPLLPADATTITPALAALAAATRWSSVPNGEPSDMLMTSMSLSTAHSIASTVDVGRAVAAEHAKRIQIGLRRHARPDQKDVRVMCRVVRARVRLAVGQHAEPAAVPATCEPWPLQSSGFGSG